MQLKSCCCSVTKSCLTVIPWTAAHQASPSFNISWSFFMSICSLTCMSIELVMPSNHIILCPPFLLLPSFFPNIRVFSNESAPHIKWPKYWSFSFKISPSNEYWRLIFFRIDWDSQGTLKSYSSTTVLKHQSFDTQPSWWSSSHIHMWLLEKV